MKTQNRVIATQLSLALAGVICFAAVVTPAQAGDGPVRVDETAAGQHSDIVLPVINGVWEPHVHEGLYSSVWENYQPEDAFWGVGPQHYTQRPNNVPNFANFDFIGIPEGGYLWVLPQSNTPGQIFMGWRADFGFDGVARMASPTPDNWSAWDPDGPGPLISSFWVQFELVDMRGPGDIAVWQTGAFGDPTRFITTADGITPFDPAAPNADADAFITTVGGHSHADMAFTEPGTYELDLRGRTFDAFGFEQVSPVATFTFVIELPECSNPNGDLDGSGEVDLADFARLQACVGQPITASADCTCSNLDPSAAIDASDLEAFAAILNA